MGNLAIISDLHVDINQFSEQEWLILWKVLTDKGIELYPSGSSWKVV